MTSVLITGGTGMIGKALTAELLAKGYSVVILTRNPDRERSADPRLGYAAWDPQNKTIDAAAIEKSDYIIHLAGANIAEKRWTGKRKKEIVESRVSGSSLLVKALKEIPNKVRAVICASAIGWYGTDPVIPNNNPFTEDRPSDPSFLGDTCKRWEASIDPVSQMGKRLVKLRTGIVLSKTGGAIEEFKKPLKFGIATILASGRQMISWIHLDDLTRMYVHAIGDEKMHGVFNAVSPQPVPNKTLVLELAKQVKGKFYVPVYVPSFALKLALGEMSIEVLKSTTVSCEKVHRHGFVFLFPEITHALKSIV
jgi:uncharacterized protein (TIGR01777 family)